MAHELSLHICRQLPLQHRSLSLTCPACACPAVHNTVPNAALRREDGTFAPAHMLPDARLERAGRQSRVERQVGWWQSGLEMTHSLLLASAAPSRRHPTLPARRSAA